MKSLKAHLTPFLLFLISLVLRISLISKGPYHGDCLALAIAAQKTVTTSKFHFIHAHGYPLTSMIGALFVFVTNLFSIKNPVWAVNFMSVLFSSLCIPIFYYFAKKLLNPTAALSGAILFSLSPIFLGNSLYGNSHPINIFFNLLGFSLLLTHFKTTEKNLILFSGISFGLAAAARIQDTLVIVPAILIFIFTNVRPLPNTTSQKTKTFIHVALIAALTTIFFYCPLLFEKLSNKGSISNSFASYVLAFWNGISLPYLKIFTTYLLTNFSLGGFILIFPSFFMLANEKPKTSLFILAWILVPFLLFSTFNTTIARYFIIVILPLYILQGFLFGEFFKKNRYFKYSSIIVFLLISLLPLLETYPVFKTRNQHAYLPEYAEWIGRQTEKHAVIIPADEGTFVEYYGKRKCLRRPRGFYIKISEAKAFKNKLDNLLDKDIPVYITGSGLYSYNFRKWFSNFIQKNYRLELRGSRLAEDWHGGVLKQTIGYEHFYKITQKSDK